MYYLIVPSRYPTFSVFFTSVSGRECVFRVPTSFVVNPKGYRQEIRLTCLFEKRGSGHGRPRGGQSIC